MKNGTTGRTYRYAGLGKVSRPGLAVPECAARLARFRYIEERLMQLQAAHLVSVPERDIKLLLARFQNENARHVDALRRRLRELRVPKNSLDAAPDEALGVLMDEATAARNTGEVVAAVRWLYIKLQAAYNTYLEATNHLADSPSVDLIKAILLHVDETVTLLNEVYEDVVTSSEQEEEAQSFVGALQYYLAAAGGVDGAAEKTPPVPRERSVVPHRIEHELARDEAVGRVWDFVAPPQAEVGPHLAHMMSIRLSEINVAEGLAIVLYETQDKPWEFYLAISRHLWDEMRHSMMGEAAIEATLGERSALPMRDYEGVYCMEATPLEQYAVLGLEVEGANMRYPIGKRGEWEFCKEAARHPLMTTFQDFDWADEVLHVNIAREQLAHWFEGGVKELSRFAADGKGHRTQVKKRHPAVTLPDIPDLVERGQRLAGKN